MTEDRPDPSDLIGSELVREDSSFADVVTEFVEGLQRRVAAMEEAINAADFEALRTAAHQLKGSGGGYGYPVLSEQAARLEREANARALDDCCRSLEELRQLCERIVVSADGTGDATDLGGP